MAKALKRMMVSEYEKVLDDVDGLIVLDPGPMTVEANQAFRKDLREKAGGAKLQVVHNRTVRIALEKAFYGEQPEALDEMLKGTSAIVFGGDGPIPIAKVLREWKRKFKSLRVKGGVSEGEVLGAVDAEGLADLPSGDELRAMLLSTVQGPSRGIVGSLAAVYGGIVRALNAHVEQEGGGDGGPAGD